SGQTSDEIPRLLWAISHGGRSAEHVVGENSANIDLVGGRTGQLVDAVGAVEMPLGAEIVVDTDNAKIIALWDAHIGLKALLIDAIAARGFQNACNTGTATSGIIGERHHGGPHLLNEGIDADPAGIARIALSGSAIRAGGQIEDRGNGG